MKRYLLVSIVVACGGCVSLGNPFVHVKPNYAKLPAEVMKQVALEIEQAVQKGEREPNIADRDGIVVNTDVILQAIRTRAIRSELVNQLLDANHAYEGRDGQLWVLHSREYKKSTASGKRTRDAGVVMNESTDRWAIYEGIVEASKLPSGSRSAVQAIFHDARIQCMTVGQKYEDAAGNMKAK